MRSSSNRRPLGLHTYLDHHQLCSAANAAAALQEAQLESPGFWQDYALTLAQQAQSDRAHGRQCLCKSSLQSTP